MVLFFWCSAAISKMDRKKPVADFQSKILPFKFNKQATKPIENTKF